jgi:hypothetical protein
MLEHRTSQGVTGRLELVRIDCGGLMLGQRSDTDFVALRLDPPETTVRRIEVTGSTDRYSSIAEALADV